MGKRLIQQARGKGGPTYRTPSFRYYGEAKMPQQFTEPVEGIVSDLVKCPGHSAPLAQIKYAGQTMYLIAPEGIKVGDRLMCGGTNIAPGNILTLKDIPVGTVLFNIENQPGDGGKFCRSSGTFAKIVEKGDATISIELPSKKIRKFLPNCRANIGVVAGGGRLEKPLLKAGRAYHKYRAKNKLYPRISGTSQNSVDHPFGGSSSGNKGRPTTVPKNAPPGRKVGKYRPRRTGYKR